MLFFTQCFGAVLDLIHLRFQHYKAKRVFSAAGQLVCVVNPTHNLKVSRSLSPLFPSCHSGPSSISWSCRTRAQRRLWCWLDGGCLLPGLLLARLAERKERAWLVPFLTLAASRGQCPKRGSQGLGEGTGGGGGVSFLLTPKSWPRESKDRIGKVSRIATWQCVCKGGGGQRAWKPLLTS